jgi:hypothetical protein
MDAVKTVVRHHPSKDYDNIAYIHDWIRRARQDYLESGLSDECQIQLGNAFHLIQDGFIASDSMDEHNHLEGRLSRYLPQFTFYGIEPRVLATEREVLDFVRDEVRALEDPEEILTQACRVCLSIAGAVTTARADFELGERAQRLTDEADRLVQQLEEDSREWKDSQPEKALDSYSAYYGEQIRAKHGQWNDTGVGASWLARITGKHTRNRLRHQKEIDGLDRQKAELLERSKAGQQAHLNRLLGLAGQAVLALQGLKDIVDSGYQGQYEFRRQNGKWLGVDVARYKAPEELVSFIAQCEQPLCNVARVLGGIARRLTLSMHPSVLARLEWYPLFTAELAPQGASDGRLAQVVEQTVLMPTTPTVQPHDAVPSQAVAARAMSRITMSNWQVAMLAALAAAVVAVFLCFGALVILVT